MRCARGQVVLKALPPGYGMKGGRVAQAVLTCFGIADCTAKAHGRRTPINVIRVRHAFLTGL